VQSVYHKLPEDIPALKSHKTGTSQIMCFVIEYCPCVLVHILTPSRGSRGGLNIVRLIADLFSCISVSQDFTNCKVSSICRLLCNQILNATLFFTRLLIINDKGISQCLLLRKTKNLLCVTSWIWYIMFFKPYLMKKSLDILTSIFQDVENSEGNEWIFKR
jgi:hypothetical protein